ncbi:hypothetical protein HKX48_001365 [Thoreauomyces humboldtii]|nr:hypothetical protein HKX48_001365 [Thoreauomyces humboldtii]
MSAFLISIGLVVVFVVSVCVKLVFFPSSQVTKELVESPAAARKESPSATTLANARAALITLLLEDIAASDDETLLAGWTTPLGGNVEDNAKLLSVISLTDANLPGLSVRDRVMSSYADVAQELIDSGNVTTALEHELGLRSARRVPSSLVPKGCTNVRAEKTNWLNVGHNLPSKALNNVIIYGTGEEDVDEVEEDAEEEIQVDVAVRAKVEIEEDEKDEKVQVDVAVVAKVKVEVEEGHVGRIVKMWSQAAEVAVAEEGDFDAAVEQEVVVVVAGKVEEVTAAVEQEVVVAAIVVEEVKELAATVEEEVVVAVAVIINEVKEVAATAEEEAVVAVEDFNVAEEKVLSSSLGRRKSLPWKMSFQVVWKGQKACLKVQVKHHWTTSRHERTQKEVAMFVGLPPRAIWETHK